MSTLKRTTLHCRAAVVASHNATKVQREAEERVQRDTLTPRSSTVDRHGRFRASILGILGAGIGRRKDHPPERDNLHSMSDSTRSTIEIAAAPGAVLDVIADFEAYPEWAGQVKKVTVLTEDGDGWADQVEYVLDAGAIKDTYVLTYDWDQITEDGTGSVSWALVRATVLTALNGTYTLTSNDAGTLVEYQLEVDVRIPMIGMLKRKAEKIIIDTALKELKKRVESLDAH